MKRKLSALEHMIDGNIIAVATLEGCIEPERLRLAIARVQRKHPVLRAIITEHSDGLYYEEDQAGEIPLRMLERSSDHNYWRECQVELHQIFPYDQPQLRLVWLRAELESDLLFVTSHRICDGMSVLIIVREVLRAIYSDESLVPYRMLTTEDIIGDFKPANMWKRKLGACLANSVLRFVPSSKRSTNNQEYHLEWSAGPVLSGALKERCKNEGVSLHAMMLVALDQALQAALPRKKIPAWIDSPMDARRGRISALKDDRLFFGGGNLKFPAGQNAETDFWTRARELNQSIREQIGLEMLDIPSRYHFCQLLKPPKPGQIQALSHLSNALRLKGISNRFTLSNLGNLTLGDQKAPIRLKDLRLYMHSFTVKILAILAYALHGEMRFCYIGDEQCLGREQAERLRDEFMALLETQLDRPTQNAVVSDHPPIRLSGRPQ